MGAEDTVGAWLIVGSAVGEGKGRNDGTGEIVGISVIVGARVGAGRHTASSSSEQSAGSVEAQLPTAMAPQHEYGAEVGQAVQAPSSRSAGYVGVLLQPLQYQSRVPEPMLYDPPGQALRTTRMALVVTW